MSKLVALVGKLWVLWLLIVLAAYLQLVTLPKWLAVAAAISLVVMVGSALWRYIAAPAAGKIKQMMGNSNG